MQQHFAPSGLPIDQIAGGVGGSGIVLGLDPTEQAALNGILAPGDVFTVGATFDNAQGGVDEIQAVNLASAVPEPSTWAMIILGFMGVGSCRIAGSRMARRCG